MKHSLFLQPATALCSVLLALSLTACDGDITADSTIDVPGENTGGPGDNAGGPDEDADGPGGNAGDPDEDAGDPDEDAGDPDEDAGDPDEDAGDLDEDAGDSDEDAGDSDEDAGDPDEGAGDSDEDAGDSDEGAGDSDEGAGDPDNPSGEAGTATSTAGVVCDYIDSTYNDSASVMATSTSEWTCSDTERTLTANGIPDHAVGVFPNSGNPHTIGEVEVSVSYSLTPTSSMSLTTLGGPSGPVGYVLNGVKIDAATAGSCTDNGEACSLVDSSGSWSLEALGQSSFDFGDDENNAHVQPSGAYHYHGMPEGFITKQGGNSSTMTLIAWAADGFPIYARYGYSDAADASSALVSMTGSYQLVTSTPDSRPSADTYALGTFAQDWEYVEGSGDLDACNGRVGVTPEFPGGTYHYYATDSYPYFQRCVTGTVEGGGGGGPGGGPPQ